MQLIGRQHYSTHTSFFLASLSPDAAPPAVKLEEAHKYVQAGEAAPWVCTRGA